MQQTHTQQHGMIALVLVILVASMTVVYGLAVALMMIDEQTTSLGWLSTGKATGYNSSCVQNTLGRLRNNTGLTGNVNIAVGNVNCVSAISGSGNMRTVLSAATSTDPFGNAMVDGVNVNVNVNTNPFTISQYKDIIQ